MRTLRANARSASARFSRRSSTRSRRALVAAGAALLAPATALLAAVPQAHANGRFPSANELLSHPGDPREMLLETTYGLLLSKDGGGSWDWICERAVGYSGVEDPAITITSSGAIVAALFEGLFVSSDGGCRWTREERVPKDVIDLTVRPAAPDTVYAIAGRYAGKGDAGSLFHDELYVGSFGGAGREGGESTWSRRASLDPTLLLESVEAAPSSPTRLYISAIRDGDSVHQGFLLVSDDDGKRWTTRALPLEATEHAPLIAAVDPHDAGRVYLRTSGPGSNRLLVTDDAGKTFRTLYRGGALPGFALSPSSSPSPSGPSAEGDTVYVGGPTDGLLAAHMPEGRFEKRWDKPVQCLALRGSTLWACSSPAAGFELGSSDDGGKTFTGRLTLAGMRGPLACDGGTAIAACEQEWDALRRDFGMSRDAAPAAKASPDAQPAPVTPPRAESRCGCSVPGGSAPQGGAIAALGLVVVAWRARGGRRGSERRKPTRCGREASA